MVRPRTPAGRARETNRRLGELYPGSANELCALDHGDAFQLLAATILSAQCTDERVNLTTPGLFARFPDAESLAVAPVDEVEALIRPTGFFRAKTRSLIGMATAVVERFDGVVPTGMDDLVTLPGVGRKTANVLRSVAFDLPGLPNGGCSVCASSSTDGPPAGPGRPVAMSVCWLISARRPHSVPRPHRLAVRPVRRPADAESTNRLPPCSRT
jgi:hypothetical protein